MRLLVCGSRVYSDREFMRQIITEIGPDLVIHGAYRGADMLADSIAKELGIGVEPYKAEWTKYGPAAGPIRNQKMLDEGHPDMVVAFFDGERTDGTTDMVRRAARAGVLVREYGIKQECLQTTLF